MISDSLAVPSNDPSSHQYRDRIDHEVEASTHEPAMDGQTPLVMDPRVECVGWARSIELEVMERLRQTERGTTWHPIVRTSTRSNPSSSHPQIRLPPEILGLILHFIRPGMDTIYDDIPFYSSDEVFCLQEDSIGTLATCCHVCRIWAALCQELLFSWVVLRKSAHLDSLFGLHRASRLSHISPLIRRISVAYSEPNDKLGEALPRIATMAPPNLLRIDVVWDVNADPVNFPFHDSLPLRLAPLHYVRVLYLCWLEFTNLSEFRQLISCFSGLQVLYFVVGQIWNLEVPRALHRTANPLLTRISASPYENGLWLWLSPHGSGTGRQSRCSTAQISCSVPSVSAAIVTFMYIVIERTKSIFDLGAHTLDVEWKCKKCARVDQTQWSLYIRLIHDEPQHHMPIPFTVLLEFQPQTNLPHPSFDLSHLVEIRTTIHSDWEDILKQMDTITSMWQHDELIGLDNLERLRIGIYVDLENPLDKSQMKPVDYLKNVTTNHDSAFFSKVLGALEHGFKPLREWDRLYELGITLNGFPLDDLLRVWKGMMAKREIRRAQKKVQRARMNVGEGMEVGERTEELAEDQTDSDSEWSSDYDLADFD
ncbi:hypothetical protein NLI96_g6692 [Meripilus lineatus]|uniref:F-box domain-containing protein n=1 Tax=Meripilus lineatus TaxID=2056292 RepID=A0AAD5V0F0_9APHY|nr:hypothetical protein NLI96_g6692 [Physisporinus lineatus]